MEKPTIRRADCRSVKITPLKSLLSTVVGFVHLLVEKMEMLKAVLLTQDHGFLTPSQLYTGIDSQWRFVKNLPCYSGGTVQDLHLFLY